MTTEPNNAKLFAKIAQVMAKVRKLEKTGENKFDRYSYVTADAIAARLGSVMAEVGIAFLPSMVGVETSEYTTQKGGSNFRTVVTMQMTFACTETGAVWTSLWQGEAIDRSDKSISKAAVSCVKYALLKTFLLSGGDEDDAEAESPAVEAPQPTQARNTTRAPAPPRSAPPVQPQAASMSGPPPIYVDDELVHNGDVLFERNVPWYADARNNLPAAHRKVADDMLTLHRNNGGPASAKAYGYLCGLIDSIVEQSTGAEDGHKRVLAVLCQMDVTGDNRPSATMTGRLLAKLATHIKDQVSRQKIVNPDYDEDTADAMVAVYRAAEAVGTPSLLAEAEIRY